MSLYHASAGLMEPIRGTLANTDNTTVLTAGADERIVIPKIRITNTTGSAVLMDVEINNGTQYYVLYQYPVLAYDTVLVTDEFLLPGEILKLKADTGSGAIDYHVYRSLLDPAASTG